MRACTTAYEYFLSASGNEFTEPIGAENISCFHMVEMYSSVTVSPIKDKIEKRMKRDGSLRILNCTSAFGMGVDCQMVSHMVHWQPPHDIESYVQEIGRGGRDDSPTTATLYNDKTGLKQVDSTMHDYCNNNSICRRKTIIQHFDEWKLTQITSTCTCCDICKLECTCPNCNRYICLQL